jgi:hypothetical protein
MPLKHSSVWLRKLGGLRNNWVDHLEEKTYREQRSFPGVGINEIDATNYAKSLVESNLPPIRFQRVGSPGPYVTWLARLTNMDSSPLRRTMSDMGCRRSTA